LNPLPAKPLLNLASVLEGQDQPAEAGEIPSRPRKALPEEIPPASFGKEQASDSEVDSADSRQDTSSDVKVTHPDASSQLDSPVAAQVEQSATVPAPRPDQAHDLKSENTRKESDLPISNEEDASDEHQVLTAIYKPESKAAWREELRAANEVAEKVRVQCQVPVNSLFRRPIPNVASLLLRPTRLVTLSSLA
jgi:striatin 1/3/4